ncbi:MAG TPA: DUF4845 domain-containing protein [Pseudomonadales bacterium]
MLTARKQRGASALGILIGVSALVACLTLVLKLGPHYIDWQTMKSVFDGLPRNVHTMSKEEIRDTLQKRFRVNSLRSFDLKEIVTIERQKTGTVLIVHYEVREPIVGNVDAVLTFGDRYNYQ